MAWKVGVEHALLRVIVQHQHRHRALPVVRRQPDAAARGEGVAQLGARADDLMYQVKRSGRGMVLYDTLRAGGSLIKADVRKVGVPPSRMAK